MPYLFVISLAVCFFVFLCMLMEINSNGGDDDGED